MRRVFEVKITGLVVIDDGQPNGPGKSTPDHWAAHEICQEMQGMQVDVEEIQVLRKVPAVTVDSSRNCYPETGSPDNKKLLAGTLPFDPEEDTEPFGPDSKAMKDEVGES